MAEESKNLFYHFEKTFKKEELKDKEGSEFFSILKTFSIYCEEERITFNRFRPEHIDYVQKFKTKNPNLKLTVTDETDLEKLFKRGLIKYVDFRMDYIWNLPQRVDHPLDPKIEEDEKLMKIVDNLEHRKKLVDILKILHQVDGEQMKKEMILEFFEKFFNYFIIKEISTADLNKKWEESISSFNSQWHFLPGILESISIGKSVEEHRQSVSINKLDLIQNEISVEQHKKLSFCENSV